MRFLLILIILTSLVTMELNIFNSNYDFAYSQQLKQQNSSEIVSNVSKTSTAINSDNSSSKVKANNGLSDYLGYQYEYNFY